jgi:large subunit ribosomal protein L10
MHKKTKAALVEDLRKKLTSAQSIFLTDFTGINVKDISELRKSFRESSVEYLVAKNTLIKRAVADTPLDQLEPYLVGPTALVLTEDDGINAAKIITRFAKEHEMFSVKAGMMSEKVVDPGQVKSIASLPSREVILARLLGILNSPITGLVCILNGTVSRAVRVLSRVAETKQSQENS